MAPIRVALIGLSAAAKTSWAEEAHLAYLNSEFGKKHYAIVALLNSSVAAAESAKSRFSLPQAKTYGDPKALASDPDIDLVVCNTRADVHLPTVEPSLRAGKAVYVEWPLTEDLASAIRLTQNERIPGSIAGLQGRVSPIPLRLKEILASGAIGKVLSSNVSAFGNLMQRDALPKSLKYFADRKVGGHQINIHFGHMIDYVQDVIGEFEEVQSKMQIQRSTLRVIGADGKETGTVKSDVPDLLVVHGTLKKGTTDIVDNATLAVTFRCGQPFKGKPSLTWSINGSKGELLITTPGPYLMSGDSYNGPITIELHDHATDEVRDMGWDWKDWQKKLPIRSRSVGEVYERYAAWVENGRPDEVKEGSDWPRLHDAMVRMENFDRLYKQFDPEW
ncbi:oxidoreductase family protein [Massariosphaeria phaeospora]|uniref:Oxidoreductase family protein n=1 Tax=Massariosphaeria phaeospora TaxID=100035 RepID=A0A7C8ICX9_9PLEO|nr:oxidoreductase family protein [Massariosphaeria phaeospora]